MSPKANPYESAMCRDFFAGLDEDPEKENKPQTPQKTKSKFTPTLEQKRAVDEARNARRGRPKKKKTRVKSKPVHFDADEALLDNFTELHYRLGRTKHDLFVEALQLLIEKYKEEIK